MHKYILPLFASLLTATFAYAQDNIVLRNGDEIPAKVLEVNQNDLKYRKSANPEGPIYTAPLRDVLLIKYANGTKDTFGPTMKSLPVEPEDHRRVNRDYEPTKTTQRSLESLRYKGWIGGHFKSHNGQRLGMSETKSALYTQPDALAAFEKGRSLRTWSLVTAIPAVALIGAGASLAVIGGEGGLDGNRRGRDNNATSVNQREGNQSDRGGEAVVAGAVLAGSGVLLGATSLWLNHRASVQFRRAANRYNNRETTSLRFVPSRQGVGIGAILTY